MENKRPRLDAPEEFAIIRSIYLRDHNPINSDLDEKERLDRMEAKQRSKKHDAR